MRMTSSWLACSLAILSLTACSNQPVNLSPMTPTFTSPEPITLTSLAPTTQPATVAPNDTISQLEETQTPGEVAISPNPTPTEHAANTLYRLTAELNYGLHLLTVEEQIEFTNPHSEAIPDLLLLVEPTRYPAVFSLKSLTWGDGTPVDTYRQEIGQLSIPLKEPILPGESITLSITYELNLPSPDPTFYGRPVPFGYTTAQTNLVDWYPFLPPYLPGRGWWANQAGPFGEHLVYDSVDLEVAIRLLDERDDLEIAASAPATIDGDWLRYRYPSARNFVWSVSHQYSVASRKVGEVTVKAYTFPIHAGAGEAALQATAEALALYNRLFGVYPRELLSVVEADFLDGMEYDGLYFLSKGFYNLYSGTPGEYLIAIAAHETAHQWWYAQVGNDQAIEPWLDEALCTFSERLYYENVHPEALEWWQQYRINYWQPTGWVDGTIYNPGGYRAYRDAIYLNGAVFLDELRTQIGEQAFLDFLNHYAQANSKSIATADDFFTLLETYSNTDLTPLLDQYFSKR
jgi:hypothetical protein